MRISHQYRFVFLSNSQSGSTSIRKALELRSDITSGDEYPYHHHTNARLLKKHFQQQNWDWNNYFKFTTVRNPWDRMVGRYHYGLRNPKSSWHEAAVKSNSFAEFLGHPFISHAAPKTTIEHFAYSKDGECLVDEILKLEDLRLNLPRVLEKLGLDRTRVPHVNRSLHKHYSAYYDDAARERVRGWFRFDIEMFDYQFEQMDQESEGFDVRRKLRRVGVQGLRFVRGRKAS